MRTVQLTVGPDGRVTIPDTHPGQIVTIQISETPDTEADSGRPIPEEKRAEIMERVLRLAQEIREELPEPWRSADHGDLLYGDDGLPK